MISVKVLLANTFTNFPGIPHSAFAIKMKGIIISWKRMEELVKLSTFLDLNTVEPQYDKYIEARRCLW